LYQLFFFFCWTLRRSISLNIQWPFKECL
jgi:hypothetical protein